MKAGQKLLENGVEVALYPEPQLIVTQPPHYNFSHQTIEAMDAGGDGQRYYYAPCTLQVVQNNDPVDHRVLYWSVNPTKTYLHGVNHISILIFHDNDVSNLTVGKIIPQGELAWKSGGQGYKGPYTYPFHSHINVAICHQDLFQNGQLNNSVNPQEVFFINDTEIIQTMGMNFAMYVPPVIPEPIVVVEPELIIIPPTEPTEAPGDTITPVDIDTKETTNVPPEAPDEPVVSPDVVTPVTTTQNMWIELLIKVIQFILAIIKNK